MARVFCLMVVIGLGLSSTVSATKKLFDGHKSPACKFRPDFSTVESTLRTNILLANTERVASILHSNVTFQLGAGLQFFDEQAPCVEPTAHRRNDPDIVALQAIALNAKRGGDTTRLANSIVLSFDNMCDCDFLSKTEKDELVGYFRAVLEDPEKLRLILEFGADKPSPPPPPSPPPSKSKSKSPVVHPSPLPSSPKAGRRLTQRDGRGVDSFVCANCDPSGVCNPLRWC